MYGCAEKKLTVNSFKIFENLTAFFSNRIFHTYSVLTGNPKSLLLSYLWKLLFCKKLPISEHTISRAAVIALPTVSRLHYLFNLERSRPKPTIFSNISVTTAINYGLGFVRQIVFWFFLKSFTTVCFVYCIICHCLHLLRAKSI